MNRRAFLKQAGLGTLGAGVLWFAPGCRTHPGRVSTAGGLPRSTPEAEGVSSTGILAFLDAFGRSTHELHSFVLVRHGRVIAEGWWSPYGPEFNHTLYSLSKSFTSTAIGFAVTEGRLRVEDRVVSFFPEELPERPSDHLSALRIRDLLTMSVGNAKEPTRAMVEQSDWVKAFLAWPIENPPGTQFLYNSAATYMLSAIVQRVTGQRVLDYLQPRLFAPLDIHGPAWETCPRGINVGGWGLSIQTEGLAKVGQLYLRKGKWRGRQVLSTRWVEEATTFKIQQPAPAQPGRPNNQNDWLQGYCYQFWRCRHNAFRGDGAFGQYMIVMPEQDAVVVMTGESRDLQGELDLVWNHLLPAMKPGPLPRDRQAETRLVQRLGSLALPPLQGPMSSPLAERVSGKEFTLDRNELGFQGGSLVFNGSGAVFMLRDRREPYPIPCGSSQWQRSETALPGTPPRLISGGQPPKGTKAKVAASGRWADPNTWEMLLRYYETPHHDLVTCRFDGNTVRISFLSSIAQMSGAKDGRPVLEGKLTG
jgi:CubicO group peptidase (beta-lactamase class C family)